MNQKAIIKDLREKVLRLQIRNKELDEGCEEFTKAIVNLSKELGIAVSIQLDYEELIRNMFGIEVISSEKTREIIEKSTPQGKFLRKAEHGYVGIDNTTGDAWTEDFSTLIGCVKWLQGENLEEIEMAEKGIRHISDTCIKPDLKCDYCKDGKCRSKKYGFCVFRKIEGWRAC